jgi:predicted AAA+ superfamily ATPase
MPGLLSLDSSSLPEYFKGYVRTYLERDVRLYQSIRDLREFDRFIGILAAVTAQEINHSQLGRDIGINNKLAKEWLLLLEATYQFREIAPYYGNLTKRISKRGKGYFTDTGIACYLQQISSPEALAKHPQLGAMFETFVVNQIIRLSLELPMSPKFYHWRTNGGAEVDLLLELNGEFYPIEIKCKTKLTKFDAKGLKAFRDSYPDLTIHMGLIIYCGRECMMVTQDTLAVPWNGVF